MKLNRVRVNRETAPPGAFPPVPTRPAQAEPYSPAPDHAPTTTAHGPHSFRGWMARLRNRLIRGWEPAIREAWANGFRGGRTVERTEIADRIRAELVRGAYDFRDGNGAARDILAYLDQETPTRDGK